MQLSTFKFPKDVKSPKQCNVKIMRGCHWSLGTINTTLRSASPRHPRRTPHPKHTPPQRNSDAASGDPAVKIYKRQNTVAAFINKWVKKVLVSEFL